MQRNLQIQKSQYFSDYITTVRQNNPNLDSKEREWVMLSKLFDTIKEDLWDKGFSEEEYDEIIAKDTNDEAAYKFLAYTFMLINPFDSIKDLKKLIKNDTDCELSDFTMQDIQKIFEASKTIDFG